jgi:hypothetical protein
MIKRFVGLLALVALLGPPAGWAQPSAAPVHAAGASCDFKDRLTFAEGGAACLSDYTLGQQRPTGFFSTVQDLLRPGGRYAVAATVGHLTCPRVVALAQTANDPGLIVSGPSRDATALAACKTALSRVSATPDCQCEVVILDGTVSARKSDFDNRFLRDELKPSPTVAQAPPPAPTPQPGVIEPEPSRNDLLESLQKRLAELEAARAGTAPVIATAPRLSARALVIGNGRYLSFGALANPTRDARAIAAKLRSFGIEVDLVLDAQRDDIIHALNEYSRKSAGKDVSILFYAGHGVQVEGINYLIPINMRADGLSAGYVKLAGISLNAALDYLPAKTRLVFLDACRDNPATRSLVATRGGATAGLAPVNAASGTLLSYATRDGATADDGDGQNSPYTTALLRHLDTPADISLVLRQVRQTVLQLTGGRQEPWEYGSLVGEQIVLPLLAR